MTKNVSIFINLTAIMVFVCTTASLTAQKPNEDISYVRSARKSWVNFNYSSSLQHYQNALDVNQSNFDATFEMGMLNYRVFNNLELGLSQYEKALAMMPVDTVFELYYELGKAYHDFEKYDNAINHYELFKKGIKDNEDLVNQVNAKIAQCTFAKTSNFVHWDGKFVNYGPAINTEKSEYCALLPLKDSFLLFTRRELDSVTYQKKTVDFENIYFSKEKNKTYLPSEKSSEWFSFDSLNKSIKGHNSVASVSLTGDSMIVYKENKLWLSIFNEGAWSNPILFSKNINLAKHQRHGCFSPDGKSIYYSSNSKKGTGGYDLYYSVFDATGNWSTPKNLGNLINTKGDEDSPFITKDGKRLYFSSTGLLGFGGYDIFYCDWQDTSWSAPINAGKPFNTPYDDIYFTIANDEKETAYLSSSRKGGAGKMDLYYFYKYGQPGFFDCSNTVAINISHDSLQEGFSSWNSNVLIAGADTVFEGKEFVLSSKDCYFKDASITNVFWKIDTEIMPQDSLVLKYDSAGTYAVKMEVLARDKANEEHRFCVTKNTIVIKEIIAPVLPPKVFKDTNETALDFGSKFKENNMKPLPEGFDVTLQSIYFNFNKHDVRPDQRKIMDANIKLIKENPNIIIKIIGHTDKVGSKEHNLILSKKRAKSTVNYLIKKGVSVNQIVAVLSNGEDETGIRYKNADGN